MTEHLHSTYVEGCFRCDLSRGEEFARLRAELAEAKALAKLRGSLLTDADVEVAGLRDALSSAQRKLAAVPKETLNEQLRAERDGAQTAMEEGVEIVNELKTQIKQMTAHIREGVKINQARLDALSERCRVAERAVHEHDYVECWSILRGRYTCCQICGIDREGHRT